MLRSDLQQCDLVNTSKVQLSHDSGFGGLRHWMSDMWARDLKDV